MWDCIHQLESEKFDLTEKMKRQKYEVSRTGKNFHMQRMNVPSPNLFLLYLLPQINVLLNRIQHAQKL